MTDEGISRALETMIREDAQRPSKDQIRDLIEAGVIDEQGRVLVGSWNMPNWTAPHFLAALTEVIGIEQHRAQVDVRGMQDLMRSTSMPSDFSRPLRVFV
jgi:hypothetical protein